MREDGGDGVVVSQAPLVEVAATRRVRVLGSLEDMADHGSGRNGDEERWRRFGDGYFEYFELEN